MRRTGVSVAIELILMRSDGALFLTWRNDAYYKGWHFPGSYQLQRESRLEAARRIAKHELVGVTIDDVHHLGDADNIDSVRFHTLSLLMLATYSGNPRMNLDRGRWFTQMPEDIILEHRAVWERVQLQHAS